MSISVLSRPPIYYIEISFKIQIISYISSKFKSISSFFSGSSFLSFQMLLPPTIQIPYLIRRHYNYNSHMLDLDKIGPDWKLAEDHGTACKPGRPLRVPTSTTSIDFSSSKLPKGHNLCQCCLNVLHKESIPLCQNSKQLQFLGFGFPLYFIFTKYAIILLTLQIVTYSALSICWALNSSVDICDEGHVRHFPHGGEGEDGVCTSWLIRFMRTQNQVTRDEIILRLSSFVIHLMGLLYMRDTIKKTNDYYDQRTTSLSDYSVIIDNLPKQAGTERRIREFMKEGVGKDFVVEQLVVLNHLEDFYQIREEKQALIKEKQGWLKKPQGEQRIRHLAELDRRLNEVNIRLIQQHDKQVALINRDEAISEKAVLVMQSQDAKNQFLQLFQDVQSAKLTQFFGAGGEAVEIDEAPQPKEIIWENINYPAEKRFVRLVVGWSLTIIFIAAVTGIFYAILMAKGHAVQQSLKDLKQHPQDPMGEILHKRAMAATILTMLAIIFFNKFCLSFVLHLFTDIQKHRTGSEYQFSFGLKYTMGLFFTTALMTLLVEDFALHNIYKQEYGVVEEESMMYFFNSFLVPIIWLLNPWYLYKLAKRACFKGNTVYTQREANALMENPKYSMGKKYAELIQSVWFTYLYYSIIPGGSVLILLGLIFFYWVDKYTLLRRSSINQNVNGELSMRAMKLIDATLVMRAVGEMIFDYQIRDGVGWQPILCICIGGVYLVLPVDSILEFFHQEKFRAQQKPYKEVKTTFLENYRTLHPLYAKQRYALISGIDIVTQIASQSNNFLLNETQQFNDTKQEIMNPMDVIRQARMEVNNTTEQIIEIRPKNALLQMKQ